MFNLTSLFVKEKQREYLDDLDIMKTWAEYTDDNKTMQYLMYEMQMENPDGQIVHLYKALKFIRIIRLPKSAKQSEAFMSMHAQILGGVWSQNINFTTIIANILEPKAIGLIFCYGVQGVGSTIEQAKAKADFDFAALQGALQGTYRTLQFRVLTYEELEWIREKLFTMNNIIVVRGIPKAKDGGVDAGTSGVGGQSINPDSEDTTEEFIAGMTDHEYIVQVLSTPVRKEHLERWLERSSKEMTKWNKQLQGSSSINFGLSIPMMYMANLGASQGWSHSYTDASTVATSHGNTFSTSYGINESNSLSQSFGEGLTKSIGRSITDSYSNSHSTSIGESHTTGTSLTSTESWGTSKSIGDAISRGISNSETNSHSTGNATTDGTNQSNSVNHTDSHGTNSSQSITDGTSKGTSQNKTISDGNSKTTTVSNGTSNTTTESTTKTHTTGTSHSTGTSDSTSHGNSNTHTDSNTEGDTRSESLTHTDGKSETASYSKSNTQNDSISDSTSKSSTHTGGYSVNGSKWTSDVWDKKYKEIIPDIVGSKSHTTTSSNSNATSDGVTSTIANGSSETDGNTWGTTNSNTHGTTDAHSKSYTGSDGYGETNTTSSSTSTQNGTSTSDASSSGHSTALGRTHTEGTSNGTTHTEALSTGTTNTTSHSLSNTQGISDSISDSTGSSNGTSHSESLSASDSWGKSSGITDSTSKTTSISDTHSTSAGRSDSESYGNTSGESWGNTTGKSYGQTESDSYSKTVSNGQTSSWGKSSTISSGDTYAESQGRSLGQALGVTGTTSSGTASTMGLGPSISYSKSYQWCDQEVKNILTLLEFQNNRLMKALRGNGAFFTDIYIGTMSETARAAASILARTAWNNAESLICPLQVLDLEQGEQAHLLYHFAAFSADNAKENLSGSMESYRYSTILLPDEFTAYTHLPRISEGGVFADVEDIPKFAVPSGMTGDIFIGNILSAERYSSINGYETPFEYRLDEAEIMHAIFTGESRSGKTVAAERFICEATKVKRRATGKRFRIVSMDPKQDWRILAKFVSPERFHFYSLGNPDFQPINLNICKVPKNVNPQTWIDGIIEIYCRNYGLMERGKSLLGETLYELYDEYGVFEDSPKWRDFVPERSANVTMPKVYKRLLKHKLDLEDATKGKGRAGNEMRDSYARLIDRLLPFSREFSIETKLFGQEDGMGIDELIGKDDVIVLESYGLESTFKNFIFGCITSGFFKYAQGHEHGFLADDQYETIVVIEEANEVLCGADTAKGTQQASFGGQSEFEKILDQAASLGLFIVSITQKIADMPSSVVANSGIVFAGKISRTEDTQVVIRKIGKEERIDNRDVLKWFPRLPIGWFVCKSSRNYNFLQVEPVLVHVAHLSVSPPSNDELTAILNKKRAMELLYSS
ncbi:MAG: serine-rich protein [Ruminococcus sp.]|nr:serine-rich protein [Ruminococcus sp.]